MTADQLPPDPSLLAALRQALPRDCLVEPEEARRPFECDGLVMHRQLPLLVALPETVAQAAEVLRICHAHGTPVVARGAGTGLSGGALPLADGVLLTLSKLDQILEVDPLARTARVQPGVTNLGISRAAADHGLYYAPDPSSQVACSIGGNMAENAGGVHCLKYGLTVHNVLAARVLTVSGEEITLGSSGLDSPGLDLLALFTGSEGLLGVVVELTVRLLPLPAATRVILAGFDSVSDAGDAVTAIIGAGIVPAGLEMMDALAIQAAEDFAMAGYPRDAAALLLCELDGTEAEVADHCARVEDLLRQHRASSLRTAADPAERALLWKGRKSAFPAVGRLSPDYYCMDGTIPRHRLSHVLEEIARLAAEHDLRVANVFHAGDGNLHPLILFDGGDPGAVQRAESLGGEILKLSVAVGGCLTGEHGIGIEKLAYMPEQFSPAELAQLEAVKAALDPGYTLNPGKGIPLLRHCQEYRALPGRGQAR